jgi:hypothetical protein
MPNNTITRQWIFDKVVFHLKNETKFFTSSVLLQMIGVDVWKRIAEDVEYPTATMSAAVSSISVSVSTPSDFIKVRQHKEIFLRKENEAITNASNVPTNYWLDDTGLVNFYPPVTTTNIQIPYVSEPTSLSTDAATNELTERGRYAAIYWVVSECMLRDNDARYTSFLALYNNEVQRLRGIFGDICGIPGVMQVHEAPIRTKP